MDITSEIKIATCEHCAKSFEYEEVTFNGSVLKGLILCDPCEIKHKEKTDKDRRKAKAVKKWENTVPTIYRGTDIEHPQYHKQMAAHNLCMRWVNGENIGADGHQLFLGMVGDSGICKTRIVSQMVKRMIWQGQSIFWINSSQFQWACQHLHDDSERGKASQVIKSARGCPVLVLDDIGSLKATEIVSDTLYAILEHRTSNEKPMIWTSNETLDEMLPGNKISEKAKKRNISRLAGYSNIISIK